MGLRGGGHDLRHDRWRGTRSAQSLGIQARKWNHCGSGLDCTAGIWICRLRLLVPMQGWMGEGSAWQFVLVLVCRAVTAFTDFDLVDGEGRFCVNPWVNVFALCQPDDIAIWGVLALIMLDWTRVGRRCVPYLVRSCGIRLPPFDASDRRTRSLVCRLIWLGVCAFAADWAGLHFYGGAFLAGAVMDRGMV